MADEELKLQWKFNMAAIKIWKGTDWRKTNKQNPKTKQNKRPPQKLFVYVIFGQVASRLPVCFMGVSGCRVEVDVSSSSGCLLWHNDAIWWHRSGSISVQVMVCCLTAPSHYMNQCWLIISEILWHSTQTIFEKNVEDINRQITFEMYTCKITSKFLRRQWVNTLKSNQNGRQFSDDIFKCIFLNWNIYVFPEVCSQGSG